MNYKTESERFIGEANPGMRYVDKPYHDFVIENPEFIRVEVLKMPNVPNKKLKSKFPIRFSIRNGVWKKSLGSDYLVTVGNRIYYGLVEKVNDYIQKTMKECTRRLSFVKNISSHSRGRTYLNRDANTMEYEGRLKSIPLDQAFRLENLIKEVYENGWN